MTTLTKIIVTTLLSLLLFSCNFDINLNPGITGNGKIVKKDRNIKSPFNSIQVDQGLDVYLTQSDNENITVEADENLQNIIITEVVGNVLKIHTKTNIGKASSKKIHVSFKDILEITSTSGSDVYSNNTITADKLKLQTTSGSGMTLMVNTSVLTCKSSSGSNIKLSGKTIKLIGEASSGSDIKAGDLIAESCNATASSGSGITLNTSKELLANASSGASITYYGNPQNVKKNDSPSGSINKR